MLRWRRGPGESKEQLAKPAQPPPAQVTSELAEVCRQALDRVRDAILLADRDRQLAWMNAAASSLFEAPLQRFGRPLLEIVRDHRLSDLVASATSHRAEQSAELAQAGGGQVLRAHAIPLAEPDGWTLLIVQDHTHLRHLETVRQQFVANLTHELRTPLAGLDLAAQTLAGQNAVSGQARAFVERILQESQRMTSILNTLAQLAALDAEEIPVDREPFAVADLLEENLARFSERAQAAGLIFRMDAVPPDLTALGDRAKTDQALQSLVDNAIKFTTRGEVVLSAELANSGVEITVEDTGIGIPANDLGRIFERFYKVDRVRGRQLPGSGLGLSIARHLIELQHGSLVAESTPGVGTTMRIRLPRVP
jgi:two-component system phosphate regulon sensor histidine kinase PhoR